MLTYRSGRFWLGKTSFILPEECLIDSETPVDPFCGFVLYPPDKSCRIELQFFPENGSARQGMEKDLSEVSNKAEILPVRYSCGDGWATSYLTCKQKCYDLRFDISPVEVENGQVMNTLDILVYVDPAVKIEDALKAAFFRELINGIQM